MRPGMPLICQPGALGVTEGELLFALSSLHVWQRRPACMIYLPGLCLCFPAMLWLSIPDHPASFPPAFGAGDELTALVFAKDGLLYSGHISGAVRKWELPVASSEDEDEEQAPAGVPLEGQQQQQGQQQQEQQPQEQPQGAAR